MSPLQTKCHQDPSCERPGSGSSFRSRTCPSDLPTWTWPRSYRSNTCMWSRPPPSARRSTGRDAAPKP
eukprot:4997183-Pyramimonas_sp.AAC.1